MGVSSDEEEAIVAVNIVASSLSILGSLFVILVYCGFSEVRSYSFRLVLYMSICDLLLSFANLLGSMDSSHEMCIAQAVLISYFGLASILWSAILALSLYLFVVKQNMTVPDFEFKFALFAFGFPILMTFLPFSTSSYGDQYGQCWIEIDHAGGIAWAVLQFYIPLWLTVIFNSYCFYLAYKELQVLIEGAGNMPEEERQLKLSNVSRLKYYPLVLVLCWIFSSINAVYMLAKPDSPSVGMIIMDQGMGSMQGFLDALVYGLNPTVRAAMAGTYQACCPCFFKKQDMPNRA
jgi:hypothetical protein